MDLYKLGDGLQQLYHNNICNFYLGNNKTILISFIENYYNKRTFILTFKLNGDVVIEESQKESINILYAHYHITNNNPSSIDKAFDNAVQDIIDKIQQAYLSSHESH